jgi:hypothetical protein
MGIQSFTPSSGGLPGLEFINQVLLTSQTRSWAQSGGAGTYTIKSSTGQPGYAYFIGNTTVGGPLNGVIEVPAAFTSIKVIGTPGDLASLYKVSVKPTTSFATIATSTTYTSTQTGISLPSNRTGFVDALMVGGGGGGSHHGSGAGGGGVLILNSFPLSPGTPFNVQVGSVGAQAQNGGDTIFAGTAAKGGAGAQDGSNETGKNGGCSSGGSGNPGPGSSTQGNGVTAIVPIPGALTATNYGTIATAIGYGGLGAPGLGANHQGGGGGGAGGNASGIQGGPALAYNFTGTVGYYAAGGYGGRYNGQGHGTISATWSASGYGMGGNTRDNTVGPAGTGGVVIVRSYDL